MAMLLILVLVLIVALLVSALVELHRAECEGTLTKGVTLVGGPYPPQPRERAYQR